MSLVVNYGGQYVRVDIAAVTNPDAPDESLYFSWCSDAFGDLRELPNHHCSRFIAGSPAPTYAEACRRAFDWIKSNWSAQFAKPIPRAGEAVLYSVWIFRGDARSGFEFVEFTDAKAFADAAQKGAGITRIGITNNESPQYLTLWEKS